MSNSNQETNTIKAILLGESGVGKTSIIKRYISNEFNPTSISTLGACSNNKTITKNKVTYNLDIWDTTGQEKYHSITNLFIKGSDIIVLVYSINSKATFDGLNFWCNSVKEKIERENYILAIVGSKCDLTENEEVPEEEGRKFAKEKNAVFKLVSAKVDPNGINKLFDCLLDEYILKIGNNPRMESIVISKSNKRKNKKCC